MYKLKQDKIIPKSLHFNCAVYMHTDRILIFLIMQNIIWFRLLKRQMSDCVKHWAILFIQVFENKLFEAIL